MNKSEFIKILSEKTGYNDCADRNGGLKKSKKVG